MILAETKRPRATILGNVVFCTFHLVIGYVAFVLTPPGQTLSAYLIGYATLVGIIALWSGRDLRERVVGVLAVLTALAVGLQCQRLPGIWPLVTMFLVFPAIAFAFAAWRYRRTPRASVEAAA